MQADETNQTNKWAWLSTTSRYYAPSFEREVVGGKTTDYTYIEGPHGPVAAVQTSGNKHDVWLLATDHLGCIVGVWNAQGTLLEEHRYTAWGLRTSSTASPRLRRGFTGHEHLTQFGIIDMQARLYDPHLGRFLAPDPYVQAPERSMNFNRYAYCMNNPLKYTDPTGEFCIGAAIFIGGFINFAIQGITNNINSFGDCVKAWTIGGLAGLTGAAAGAAVAGAINVSGFLGGAAVGAAGGAAGGFVGGAGEAWLSGESLGDGLKQGLMGAGIGALSGGLIGGVIGGIEAAVDGKDFWSGKIWETTANYELPNGDLPIHQQADKHVGCTQETLESIAEYKGRSIDPNQLDKTVGADFAQLAKEQGFKTYTILPNTPNCEGIVGAQLTIGNPSAITYNQHTVGVSSIKIQQVERVIGSGYRTRHIIKVMDYFRIVD